MSKAHEHSASQRGFKAMAGRRSYRYLPRIELSGALPPAPLSIADMAELFGVTHRTLHFYEEKGLISSGRAGAMRIYGHEEVMLMAVVAACRESGMSVAAIQDMLEEMRRADAQEEAEAIFRNALLACRRELTAGISTIRRQIQQIDNLLQNALPGGGEAAGDTPALSETEQRCLRLMAEGHLKPRLAETLGLSEPEVAALEDGILRKFGASNRFQAIAKAIVAGIVAE